MNDDIAQERSRLDARSRQYEQEIRQAAGGLRSSIRLVPQAAAGLRHAAPALPLIAAAAVVGLVIWRLRARRAPPILMVGGLLFDALRLWTLQRPASAAPPSLPPASPELTELAQLPIRNPASAAAPR